MIKFDHNAKSMHKGMAISHPEVLMPTVRKMEAAIKRADPMTKMIEMILNEEALSEADKIFLVFQLGATQGAVSTIQMTQGFLANSDFLSVFQSGVGIKPELNKEAGA